MKSVNEVFGAESPRTYINLNWAGRVERPTAIAARLSATMSVLSEWTGLQWYRDTADRMGTEVRFELVPTEVARLTQVIDSTGGNDDEGSFSWTGFFQSLRAGSDPSSKTLAVLNGSTASIMEQRNQVKLQLTDEFPLGTPSQAAHWFLDLVRIWQPDQARLSTLALQKATGFSRAGYLSWTSSKAYTEPESDAEILIPFGDGALRVSRTWTVDAIVQINRELEEAGAPEFSDRPAVQDPPHFPEGYPEGLDSLDHEVSWARENSSA